MKNKFYNLLPIAIFIVAITFVVMAFTTASPPQNYYEKITTIVTGSTTQVFRLLDNGRIYIIVINDKTGCVAITKVE